MKELASIISRRLMKEESDAIALGKDYQIKKDAFIELPSGKSTSKLAFVDGGSLDIIKSPSLLLSFNRIFSSIYKSNKRLLSDSVEFFSIIMAEPDRSFLVNYYFTKGKLPMKEYRFNADDPTLSTKGKNVDISAISNAVRRFAELTQALRQDCPVMLDGSLDESYTFESDLLNMIRKRHVCGLSKTTDTLTRKGDSAVAGLSRQTDKDSWYFQAGDTLFVKLHKRSPYIFRLDMTKLVDSDDVLRTLTENAKDPIFLGYPYALVEADRFARVSIKEKERITMQLASSMGKDYRLLIPYINSQNAHSILDNIS